MSYALRFNYVYKDKYIASFTTRWDGASHLAEGHKWEAFPAVLGMACFAGIVHETGREMVE